MAPHLIRFSVLLLILLFTQIATASLSFAENTRFNANIPRVPRNEPYLSNMGVLPEYRGIGIGSSIIKECEKITMQNGKNKLYLHVREDDERAVALYVKNDFVLAQEMKTCNILQKTKGVALYYKELE